MEFKEYIKFNDKDDNWYVVKPFLFHTPKNTPYTSTFVLAECCVFNKQSQPPILCDPPRLTEQVLNLRGHTFSRSYGINLPSSFSRVLSSAWEYSSRAPVLVCGTVVSSWSLEAFLGTTSSCFASKLARPNPSAYAWRIYLPDTYRSGTGTSNTRTTFHDPSPHRTRNRCWNINQLPISYGFRPHLRGRLTLRRWTLRRKPCTYCAALWLKKRLRRNWRSWSRSSETTI